MTEARNFGLALLAILPLAFFTSGCEQNQIHRAAKASNIIADSLAAGIEVKRELRRTDQIDDHAAIAVTRAMLDFTRIGLQSRQIITGGAYGLHPSPNVILNY